MQDVWNENCFSSMITSVRHKISLIIVKELFVSILFAILNQMINNVIILVDHKQTDCAKQETQHVNLMVVCLLEAT